MVKHRLEGLPSAVEAAAAELRARCQVIDESRVYPNRPPSKLVRQYVTVMIETPVVQVTVAREADENRQLVERRQLGQG